MRILLIEDDKSLAEVVREALSSQHYLVDLATDGEAGLQLADALNYDLILLDLILPKLNGLNVCKERRKQGDRTPILLITGEDTSTTKVAGLDAGADDYLVKPFDLQELLARIRALLRRSHDFTDPVIKWGDLHLDPSSCQVTYQGQILKLTAKEYALLELFLRNPQRIFSQSALLDDLWSFDDPPSDSAVRTLMKSLRQKLKIAGVVDMIETIYGLGYRLKSPTAETPQPLASDAGVQLNSKIQEIWEKQKSKYSDRITLIETAFQALQQQTLTPQLYQEAIQNAHTLAGSLGSFGFQKASQLSREIETLLKHKTALTDAQTRDFHQLIETLRQELQTQPISSSFSSPSSPSAAPLPHLAAARLLVVDDDSALAEALVQEAHSWGLDAQASYTLENARKLIQTQPPQVVVLDLSFPESTETGFELLAELTRQNPPIPVIVFTAKESFSARVKVARLGGRGFLQKPVLPHQVMETVSQVLQREQPHIAKLLIVDDNPEILDWLRTVLEPWGLKLILLDDPQQFWQTLEQCYPDLLILGVEMAGINGIELCQVVRNDPKWNELPILILSSHRDSETVQQVFLAGADDYIQKPIVEPELIARVFNRLERSQLRRTIVKQVAVMPPAGLGERERSSK